MKKYLPFFLLIFLQKFFIILRVITYKSSTLYCIFCKKNCKGYHVGLFPNFELACSSCHSLGRHRHLSIFLESLKLDFLKIIHFSAEKQIKEIINKKKPYKYLCVNKYPNESEIFCDIENIHFNENYFDIVICSHVLEHVNYEVAISELSKILKKNGIALLMFPIIYQWEETYSNSDIVTKKLRELHFGQFDHLHLFGKDIEKKLIENNFSINKIISYGEDSIKNGIKCGEILYVAKKT